MKNYVTIAIVLLFFYACEQPQEIRNDPPHRSRVPVVSGFTAQVDSIKVDTTAMNRIMLSWKVDTTGNFKKCEIYRTVSNFNGTYTPIANDAKKPYATDLFVFNKSDSVLYYYARVQGKDFFYGKNSDTISVRIYKKK